MSHRKNPLHTLVSPPPPPTLWGGKPKLPRLGRRVGTGMTPRASTPAGSTVTSRQNAGLPM